MKDRPGRKLNRSRSPHHRVVYANQTMITVTNVDLRLRFGVVEKVTKDEIRVEDQVDVILGPVEAAGVAQLIVRHLEKMGVKLENLPIGDEQEDGRFAQVDEKKAE